MIVLDASAVVYLTKIERDDEDGVRGGKVDVYLRNALRQGRPVILPAVALAESASGPDIVFDDLLSRLELFEIVDFDLRAARVAGEIARTTNWKALIPPVAGGRQIVKLDILIAAAALAANAQEILTNDHRYDALVVGRPIAIKLIDSLP